MSSYRDRDSLKTLPLIIIYSSDLDHWCQEFALLAQLGMCPTGIRPAECIVYCGLWEHWCLVLLLYGWMTSPNVLVDSTGRLHSHVLICPINDLFHKKKLFQGVGCALYHGWVLYRRGRSRCCCCLWVLAAGGVNQSHRSNNIFCVLRTFEYAACFNTCSGMIFSCFFR